MRPGFPNSASPLNNEGRKLEKNSGQELRVNSSHIDEHFLLHNMGFYFNPQGGAPLPQSRYFSSRFPIAVKSPN